VPGVSRKSAWTGALPDLLTRPTGPDRTQQARPAVPPDHPAREAPLLPRADELAHIDVDDTLRQTYGYAKQGAGRDDTGVKGLNALPAIVSTPTVAPVMGQLRLAGLRDEFLQPRARGGHSFHPDKPCDPDDFGRRHRKPALKRAGLPHAARTGVRFHDLRHICASLLFEARIPWP